MLASGFLLMASDWISWHGAFVLAAVVFLGLAAASLAAPRERKIVVATARLREELAALARSPFALAVLAAFALGVVWLVDGATRWSSRVPGFWALRGGGRGAPRRARGGGRTDVAAAVARMRRRAPIPLTRGPMFGALMELLSRPGILPVLLFILIFKLPDAAMGFMVKPFWVDAGFTAAADRPGLGEHRTRAVDRGRRRRRLDHRPHRHLQRAVDPRASRRRCRTSATGSPPASSRSRPSAPRSRSSTRRSSTRRARPSRSPADSARPRSWPS